MNKSFFKFSLYASPLFVGVLLAFFIQSVAADIDPVNNDTATVTPRFSRVLIGDGSIPSIDSMKVQGSLEVGSTLKVDDIYSHTAGEPIVVDFLAHVKAPAIGNYYVRDATCTNCARFSTGDYAGMYYGDVYCNDNDIIVSCMGYPKDLNAKLYGYYVFEAFDNWYCRVYTSSPSITASAVCLSPNITNSTDNFN
ncbi:hypothetical protein KKC94_00415 [Patescibacteria group bacterium]|nr:hypothetical protein [Patescibacteria group bacterium]